MKISFTYIAIFLLATSFFSCNKFLDVQPKGYVIPQQYSDFDLMLNNERSTVYEEPSIKSLSDDWDYMGVNATNPSSSDKIYLWQEQYSTNIQEDPPFWSWHYANIYNFNTILKGIPKTDTAKMGRSLRAEALLARAFEYLRLVTLYGDEYNGNNGNSLGVPFVTSIYINEKAPPRSTIEENYKQILNDLYEALPNIPLSNLTNRSRGSQKAVYGVLARTYLHLRNYDSAYKYAVLAQGGQEPTNFVDIYYKTFDNSIDAQDLPTTIYAKHPAAQMFNSNITPSLGLLQSYGNTDYRLKAVANGASSPGAFTTRGIISFDLNNYFTPTLGITVDEMWLIEAECEARKGHLENALTILNKFRSYNFLPEEFTPLVSNNKDEIIKFVFEERRKEWPFTGMRWFDMRRMDVDGYDTTITRLSSNGTVIAELPPKSYKYTLQIPLKVLYFNPDMPKNNWQ